MKASPNRQMFRVNDAAAYLAISVSTMNKLRLYGGGPKFIKLGRAVVYDPADLDAWLDTHRRKSTSVAA